MTLSKKETGKQTVCFLSLFSFGASQQRAVVLMCAHSGDNGEINNPMFVWGTERMWVAMWHSFSWHCYPTLSQMTGDVPISGSLNDPN